MGMNITDNSITIDICSPPVVEGKVKACCSGKLAFPAKWENERRHFAEAPHYRVVIIPLDGLKVTELREMFCEAAVLAKAIKSQLQRNYVRFIPFTDEDPHQRMPILKDPMLVRATQIAILKIAEDPRCEDVEFVVTQYKAIEKSFRRLLRERLRATSSAIFSTKLHEQ